jgi:hypothetical protein
MFTDAISEAVCKTLIICGAEAVLMLNLKAFPKLYLKLFLEQFLNLLRKLL